MTKPSATPTGGPSAHRLLAIYLNDHLAGATGGVALTNRIAQNFQRHLEADTVKSLAADITQDRETLIAIMRDLRISTQHAKGLAAVFAERLARLKLNGRVFQRSPLSTLLELESMAVGVNGKISVWKSLLELSRHDRRLNAQTLQHLLERANQQLETLERLRLEAVNSAFVNR